MNENDKDIAAGFNEEEEDAMTVTLTLEDGTEEECLVLEIFTVGEQEYIALLSIPEDLEDHVDAEDDELEGEISLYRFKQLDNDEIELDNLESDEEIEAVTKAFEDLLEEEDDEE